MSEEQFFNLVLAVCHFYREQREQESIVSWGKKIVTVVLCVNFSSNALKIAQ